MPVGRQLVRDARDVVASMKERLGDFDAAIQRWNRDNVIAWHEAERGRPDLIIVFYEALIAKHDAYRDYDGGPQRRELVKIRDEEHAHARMLDGLIAELGGDPTALTPSADLVAVESLGIQKAIADVRTTLDQALHAILVAELADNAGWDMLCDLADAANQDDVE